MSKSTVSEIVVEVLNDLRKFDKSLFEEVLNARMPVNEAVTNHPYLVVAETRGRTTLGLVGFLNGLLAAHGMGKIASMHDDADKVVGVCLYKLEKDSPVPINKVLTADAVKDLLEELRELDTEAFETLIGLRFYCTEQTPTTFIQTTSIRGKLAVSFLGLLNKLLCELGAYRLATVMDNDVVVGFQTIEQPTSGQTEVKKAS